MERIAPITTRHPSDKTASSSDLSHSHLATGTMLNITALELSEGQLKCRRSWVREPQPRVPLSRRLTISSQNMEILRFVSHQTQRDIRPGDRKWDLAVECSPCYVLPDAPPWSLPLASPALVLHCRPKKAHYRWGIPAETLPLAAFSPRAHDWRRFLFAAGQKNVSTK